MSDSAVALGVATSLQFLPTLLLGLWGGVLVDRIDRRRAIMVTQAASAVLAAALVLRDAVELWLVYALALPRPRRRPHRERRRRRVRGQLDILRSRPIRTGTDGSSPAPSAAVGAASKKPGKASLRYVWQHWELRACMLLVAVVALLGQNFRVALPLLVGTRSAAAPRSTDG